MSRARFCLPVIVLLVLATTGTAAAQQPASPRASEERLGTVHFETSCDPSVSQDFDRGVALLHSFWFSAAIDSFQRVLQKDAGCAMAYWGIAMSWWGNPFGGFRPPAALEKGLAAVEAARRAQPKTPRERDYVEAVAALFQDAAAVDQRTRTVTYEKAMEKLAERHPNDAEARIFYALSLGQTALPADKTYANQLKAAGILEAEFAKQPDHPGVPHYIIHSYDVPPLAARALDAARRYAKIAPAAPHALHMPSHTFTRLGYWQESIDTNLASAAAARGDNAASEELHALDYQVYAYLQTGQDAAALKVAEAVPAAVARIQLNTAGAAAPSPAGFFAAAAIPARYALERNAWRDAAALQARESPFAWADSITHFARALGAARAGNPAAARADVEKLAQLRDKLQAAKDPYWTQQVEIQRRVATAWITFAEGRKDEALAQLREAADMEDATEKSAVSPGPLRPARELLGEMLLEMNRPADASAAFDVTLKKEPGRFRALHGAARAAQLAGDAEKARGFYAQLLEVCRRGDKPGRPELQEARKAATN
jgi:hypothetical protein